MSVVFAALSAYALSSSAHVVLSVVCTVRGSVVYIYISVIIIIIMIKGDGGHALPTQMS